MEYGKEEIGRDWSRMFAILGSTLLGALIASLFWVVTKSDPREDMTPVVQNIHNFIRRDIFLANEMSPNWDVVRAVDAQNDTLIIRFSDLDSVRYYRRLDHTLWREDAQLLRKVREWRARLLPDSTSYEVFIALGDLMNPISYEWIIIPRVQTP